SARVVIQRSARARHPRRRRDVQRAGGLQGAPSRLRPDRAQRRCPRAHARDAPLWAAIASQPRRRRLATRGDGRAGGAGYAPPCVAQAGSPRDGGERVRGRAALVGPVTIVCVVASGPLRAAARGFSNDGRPAVTAYVSAPVAAPSWNVKRLERVRFATPYYGAHSVWVRYRLRPSAAARYPFTVWLDAVMSPDLGALNAYTLAHWYSFHNLRVARERAAEIR